MFFCLPGASLAGIGLSNININQINFFKKKENARGGAGGGQISIFFIIREGLSNINTNISVLFKEIQ